MGNAKYKQKQKDQGLCRDCSRPALPLRLHCIIHNEKYRLRYQRWIKKPGNYQRQCESVKKQKELYRKTNRCVGCSAPLGEQDKGCIHCVNCRDRSVYSIPKYGPIAGRLLENYYKKIASQS